MSNGSYDIRPPPPPPPPETPPPILGDPNSSPIRSSPGVANFLFQNDRPGNPPSSGHLTENIPPRYKESLPILPLPTAPIALNEFIATLARVCETRHFRPSFQLPRNVRKKAEENIDRSLEGIAQNVEKNFNNHTTFRYLAEYQSSRYTDLDQVESDHGGFVPANKKTRKRTEELSSGGEDDVWSELEYEDDFLDSYDESDELSISISRSRKRRRLSMYRPQHDSFADRLSNTSTNVSRMREHSDLPRSLEIYDTDIPSRNSFSTVEKCERPAFLCPRKEPSGPPNEDEGFTTVSDDEMNPPRPNYTHRGHVPQRLLFGGQSYSENSLLRSASNSAHRGGSAEFTRETVISSHSNDMDDDATLEARTNCAAQVRYAPRRCCEMVDHPLGDIVAEFRHGNGPSSVNLDEGRDNESGNLRTTGNEPEPLEEVCRRMVNALENSPLECLRPENRILLPRGKRPPTNLAHVVNKINEQRTRTEAPSGPLIPPQKAVLTVGFYNNENPNSLVQEYQVLSSQSLTALRDVFNCIFDFLPLGFERDGDPRNAAETYTNYGFPLGHIPLEKRMAKSSYFFIEDTFYNDMRSDQAEDYSRNIIEWAQDNARDRISEKTYTAAMMADTTFDDLTFQMDVPYLFVHHGNCEHIIRFKEVRGAHPADGTVKAFPKTVFRKYTHRYKCRMCKSHNATVITVNDVLAAETPCFFCASCYVAFHYDAEGELLFHDYQMYSFPAICV